MDSVLKRPHWQLVLLSGVLIGLSYPPLHLGFLAWFGLIPLIHVLLNVKPRQAIQLAFLASITANFISLYWIGFNSGAGFLPVFASLIGAVIYLGIFWSGFGFLVSFVESKSSKGLFILPFAWVSMELIRSLGALGFPWINFGLTQTEYLPLVQIADITGSYGISFWIILINIGFYQLPLDFLSTYQKKIDAVTVEQIKKSINKHINLDSMITVMVGEKQAENGHA